MLPERAIPPAVTRHLEKRRARAKKKNPLLYPWEVACRSLCVIHLRCHFWLKLVRRAQARCRSLETGRSLAPTPRSAMCPSAETMIGVSSPRPCEIVGISGQGKCSTEGPFLYRLSFLMYRVSFLCSKRAHTSMFSRQIQDLRQCQ